MSVSVPISELFEHGANHPQVRHYEERATIYGVTISPEEAQDIIDRGMAYPKGIDELGIVCELEYNQPTNEIADIAIAWQPIADVELVLEVPAEQELIDCHTLLCFANSVGSRVSLLPPREQSEETLNAYLERIEDVAEKIVTMPNMARLAEPASNYLQYLMSETFMKSVGVPLKIPVNDPYIMEFFQGALDQNFIDHMKKRLKEIFIELSGGESEFEQIVLAVMNEVKVLGEQEVLKRKENLPSQFQRRLIANRRFERPAKHIPLAHKLKDNRRKAKTSIQKANTHNPLSVLLIQRSILGGY